MCWLACLELPGELQSRGGNGQSPCSGQVLYLHGQKCINLISGIIDDCSCSFVLWLQCLDQSNRTGWLYLSTAFNWLYFFRFLAQQVLIKCLDDAANAVKTSDNKMKQKELTRRMGELDHQLNAKHTLIPLSASLLAKGVDGRWRLTYIYS